MVSLLLFEVQTLVSIGLITITTLTSVALGIFVTVQCTREITQGVSYVQEILATRQWGDYLPFQISPEDVSSFQNTLSYSSLRSWASTQQWKLGKMF